MTISTEMFVGPIGDVMLGVVIAVVGAVLLSRVLPKRLFWDKLVLQAAVAAHSGAATAA
ncbi:hypothetical protein D3C83_261610 [compost metagenome]